MINHSPIAPFHVQQEEDTTLVIATCTCSPDCVLTAALQPGHFFTPAGDQGTRFATKTITFGTPTNG